MISLNNKIKASVEIARPYNVIKWILSFLVGYFYVGKILFNIDFYLGLLVVILAHVTITIQNDIEDFEVDNINSPAKPLSSGKLSFNDANSIFYGCVILLLTVSLLDFPKHFLYIMPILLLTWAYNKRPLQLSRRPLGSIMSLSFLYSVVPLSYGYFIRNQTIPLTFIPLLIFWFILRASISLLKDYKDIRGDSMFNKKTFVVCFGRKITAWSSLLAAIIGYAGVLFLIKKYLRILPLLLLLPFGIALASIVIRSKLFKTGDGNRLSLYFHKILFLQNYFDLSILLCLILSK